MKTKIVIAALAAVAFASTTFGQGQVTLMNSAESLVMFTDGLGRPEFPDVPVPVGSVLFQLYFGPLGTWEDSLSPVGPVVPTSATTPGRIMNTVIDIPTAVVPAGSMATFQIWIWDSSFASYQEAEKFGAPIGKSVLFAASTSPDWTPPALPTLPTALAGLYPSPLVIVGPVPEPSTFLLAGLGIASLLLYRRRK